MEGTPWVRWLAIAAAVVAALLIVVLIIVQSSGDEGGDTTTTTTQAETTTSVEETTTTVEETTTTAEETTTTTVEETTTTVEETTTTTEAGTALVLADDGIGGVDFGATPEETIAYATSQLGPPDDDTGWIDAFINPYGVCPEPQVRGVAWGTSASGLGSAFTLLFTNGNTGFIPEGGEHFFGYLYFGGTLLLATVEGITSGSTNLELQTEIPSAVIQEDPLDPTGMTGYWFSDLDPADPDMLWGFSTDVTPTGTLITVNGGSTCGE